MRTFMSDVLSPGALALSDRSMRLFAVWCARQVQHLVKDQRAIDAIDVAERFANGLADHEALRQARVAAWTAVRDVEKENNWPVSVECAPLIRALDAAWGSTLKTATDAMMISAGRIGPDLYEKKLREMVDSEPRTT